MIKRAFLRAIKFKWNWILFAGIILATVVLFGAGEETAALLTVFWGSWLLVHRIIVAYKNEQLLDFSNKLKKIQPE